MNNVNRSRSKVVSAVRQYGSGRGSGGGFGKVAAVGVALGTAAVAGGVGYSYVDPQFRKNVENELPPLKLLNQAVLGDVRPSLEPSQKVHAPSVSPLSALPGVPRIPSPERKRAIASPEDTDLAAAVAALPPASAPAVVSAPAAAPVAAAPNKTVTVGSGGGKEVVLPVTVEVSARASRSQRQKDEAAQLDVIAGVAAAERTLAREGSPTRAKKPAPPPRPNPYVGKGDKAKKNELLTDALLSAIASSEASVRKATELKRKTIAATEAHVSAIRQAIDAGPDADWGEVPRAHEAAKRAAAADERAEERARDAIGQLHRVVGEGSQGEETSFNPLLAMSRQTAGKLRRELDEMSELVRTVDTERVFLGEYGHLVKEGRQRFAVELRAVMPGVDWDDSGSSKGLKGGQVDALLAHAHLRVDQLTQQLERQKLEEEVRVRKAIAEMREREMDKIRGGGDNNNNKNPMVVIINNDGHGKGAGEKTVGVEMGNKKECDAEKTSAVLTAVANEKKIKEEEARVRSEMDKELDRRLHQVAERHAKQLDEVIKAQKELYDIQHNKEIEKAVLKERMTHADRVALQLTKLEAMEAALKGRVVADVENRRQKQVWLAVQMLEQAVVHGQRGSCCMEGRRQPLAKQLEVLKTAAAGDPFVAAVDGAISPVSKHKGEYTRQDLLARFDKVYRVGQNVASMDVNGGGVFAHVWAWLQAKGRLHWISYGDKDRFDPVASLNYELLDRARAHVKKGDVLRAVKVLQQLRGEARRVASSWIADARRHEETLLAARLLLAHSAATSIKSTY